ncbi:metallo-mystery pair system four-Cys motif protein [Maribrevibacterium harenarium]|uniref:Metallo-mystery pair system four-Cys motif protein n=1 Tax=Maribrevibacterium harenarium TaxID=2589817 RepID=A0A501WYP3_9GAMM|nr:MbnP family copper-binding protein [Maribrevibacterium harenarium]TPE53394.1 metallo-mystery pair system four-Cys motif protein [Maribrevibacterium harenarium]
MKQLPMFTLTAVMAAMLAGCGDNSDSTTDNATSTKTTISGAVADGYLKGAKVCLDINKNQACDSGEPSAVTGDNGAYSLAATESDVSSYPLVVEVPATAIDSDTNQAVGTAYTLTAPAGKHEFISPLSTLVHQAMAEDSSLNPDTAAAAVKTELGMTNVDLFKDYIAHKTASTNDADTQTAYGNAHKAAQVMVKVMQANAAAVDGIEPVKAQRLLAKIAKQTVQSQGADLDTATVNSESAATLKAMLAASTSARESATQQVTINFDMQNNGTPVRCGDAITINDVNASDTAGKLVDTRFYISNLMMTDADGNAQLVYLDENYSQSKGVSLMDFGFDTDGNCSTSYKISITGYVAPGNYTGVTMTVGVPIYSADGTTKLNHSNKAGGENVPKPLVNTAMGWSWQGGRKFTRIEFAPTNGLTRTMGTEDTSDDKAATKWMVHLGSTGCYGDPTISGNETTCSNPNRLDLNFSSFDSTSQKVVLDIQKLFAESDLTKDTGGAVGCMSGTTDPECTPIFKALGLGLIGDKAGQTLTGDAVQTVFTVQ